MQYTAVMLVCLGMLALPCRAATHPEFLLLAPADDVNTLQPSEPGMPETVAGLIRAASVVHGPTYFSALREFDRQATRGLRTGDLKGHRFSLPNR